MGLFGKTKVEEKVDKFDKVLKESFAKVRDDTDTIYQWLQHFNKVVQQQQEDIDEKDGRISQLHNEIALLKHELSSLSLSLSPETIKRLIDEHYDFGTIVHRLRTIENKIEKIESMRTTERHGIVTEAPAPKRQQLKEKIVQRITRNSKDYVKGIILNMINKYGKISAMQLREMVVEEQGLVSRSSFYRLLEELEDEADLHVAQTGKEKVYSTTQRIKR